MINSSAQSSLITNSTITAVAIGAIIGISATLSLAHLFPYTLSNKRKDQNGHVGKKYSNIVNGNNHARKSTVGDFQLKEDIKDGFAGCIGNTPLIRINSLSEELGCEILAKAEVCDSVAHSNWKYFELVFVLCFGSSQIITSPLLICPFPIFSCLLVNSAYETTVVIHYISN